MKRPDMRNYFAAQIDRHVRGMMSTQTARIPSDIRSIKGSVTSSLITVTMLDGTVWTWAGGKYASRKVNGCYAPLQPKPIKD